MTSAIPVTRDEDLKHSLRKELNERKVAEEAWQYSQSLPSFIEAAWPTLKPDIPYCKNWHIDAIAEKLSAVSRGEIKRLQIWIPPQSMKSILASVMWPAWEWTFAPHIAYWTASYSTDLSGRLSAMSMTVMKSAWYQSHWGDKFKFTRDAESFFANDHGGIRLATSVGADTGTGYHGDRILIDDAINAAAADATSQVRLKEANEWFDSTVSSRGIGPDHAKVIIMQRLHEEDIAAYVIDGEEWDVLCLPERYESDHPHVWVGDPRSEGDYLWPEYRTPEASEALSKRLSFRAAGQLQQRPAAREGQRLLRHWWRFYEPNLFELEKKRPRCTMVVQSIDCPLKDKETNDRISIQAWGIHGADRYLIDIRTDHMDYGRAKRAIIEQARYVRKMYPNARHKILIENGGYGPELYTELRRTLTGAEKVPAGSDGDKVVRADSAADDLQSGNCWLPGIGGGADVSLGPAKKVSKPIHDFIEELAVFDNGKYDDQVDAWSQAMNFVRSQIVTRGRTSSAFKRRRQRVPA